MRFVLWLKGGRGVACLRHLVAKGRLPAALVLQHQPQGTWYAEVRSIAEQNAIPHHSCPDPRDPKFISLLKSLDAELFVLAGYGHILPEAVFSIPPKGTINLHGGALPAQRGSSPLNWVLVNGQREFGISIIQVDTGIDTGMILAEQAFAIGGNETIGDLHEKVNRAFPDLLLKVLDDIGNGRITGRQQQKGHGAYYPVRFPQDGCVMFDMLEAEQVHNLIRAIAHPYPGAYTYYGGRKVGLHASRLRSDDFHGVPGRVYLIRGKSVLVCAKDKCLWIDDARFEDGTALVDVIHRYEKLATVQGAAELFYASLEGK